MLNTVSAVGHAAAARGMDLEALGASVPGIAITRPERRGRRTSPGGSGIHCATCSLRSRRPRARWSWRATAQSSIFGEVSRAAQGCRHAIFMAVGTGIGAGIMVDGAILQGAHDIAGAIGWMGLDRPYREVYRRCGGFESHASGADMRGVTLELLEEEPRIRDPSATAPARITAHEVFAAYAAAMSWRRGWLQVRWNAGEWRWPTW